jgi:hypothetical protein
MGNPLQICAELKTIFRRQSSAWLDRDTLRRVRELCHAAAAAVDDAYCRAEVGRVAHCAERLYSHRDPRTDRLREQILLILDAIEDRLYTSALAWELG